MTGGLLAGAVGAGLTAFGTASPPRQSGPEAWMLIVSSARLGLLLYPAALLDDIIICSCPGRPRLPRIGLA